MKTLLLLSLLIPFSASAEITFETTKKDAEFQAFMERVDLESSAFTLNYKNTGTSVGFKVEENGEKVGKWVPTNSATNPEAQVVSYYLGRFMRMSDLVVPSAYYVAGPKALAQFRKMLEGANEKNEHRIGNKKLNLNAIAKNPNALLGVYTDDIKNIAYDDLVNWRANTINRAHGIAKGIRADSPMPSEAKVYTFKDVKKGVKFSENEYELTKQFSRIMVLDILTGQWDRWSGGNVEVTYSKKDLRARMLSRDNGGAGMNGTAQLKKYFGIVTRFDREQIGYVQELLAALNSDPAGTAKALRLRSSPKSLQARAAALIAHVNAQVKTYGESKVFFPK